MIFLYWMLLVYIVGIFEDPGILVEKCHQQVFPDDALNYQNYKHHLREHSKIDGLIALMAKNDLSLDSSHWSSNNRHCVPTEITYFCFLFFFICCSLTV